MVDYATDIKACVAALQAGGIILYPTDTIWGIGCDATNEAAVEKIFSLKNRPKEKSLIVLLAEARDVLQYVAAPPPDIIGIIESVTSPTTIIFPGALHLAGNAIADDGSIAIRVPHDPFCKALLKRFGKPIISTSANLSGAAPAAHFSEIDAMIKEGSDYVVRYRQDDKIIRTASRIVRINDDGEITVVRP
jgi:L-threonylcarbamoyladenylate synthase